MNPRNLHRRAGFTLFELVLVLILMALAASVVAPRAVHLSGRRMDTGIRQAHALARRARDLAVTKGLSSRICFNANDRRFWLEVESDPFLNPGAFEPPGDEWGRGIGLLEGVEFQSIDKDTVTFRPDGSAEDALVVLTETGGERKGLEIRGITGLSRVLEDDELDYFIWKQIVGK